MKLWFAIPLWKRVVAALVLGGVTGAFVGPEIASIKWVGDLFIRSIKMLVVPLIFFSLVSGIAAIGDINRFGKVGTRALFLFLSTGLVSIVIGLGLGYFFAPGLGLSLSPPSGAASVVQTPPSVTDMVLAMVPENPVGAMANGEILPLILFSTLIGIGLLQAGKEAASVQKIFDGGNIIMQKVTMLIMELTPFGVFALIAWVAGTMGMDAILPLIKVVVLIYAGCAIMLLAVYPLMVKGIAQLPVLTFYRGVVDAQAIAFSTSSSSATLPVTLRCVRENLGVSKSVGSFVAALGATINMNGTAVYLGVVTLFGAQIFGVDLSAGDYVLIAITSTLGAIGAAGIPGAGLIMMSLVFSSVGVPLETIALIAGIDRILDMARTATNVTGDAIAAVVVAKMVDEIDVTTYRAPNTA